MLAESLSAAPLLVVTARTTARASLANLFVTNIIELQVTLQLY